MMDQLPSLNRLSERQKDDLIQVLWAEVQALKAQVAELEAKLQRPKKGAHNSSVPPSRPSENEAVTSGNVGVMHRLSKLGSCSLGVGGLATVMQAGLTTSITKFVTSPYAEAFIRRQRRLL